MPDVTSGLVWVYPAVADARSLRGITDVIRLAGPQFVLSDPSAEALSLPSVDPRVRCVVMIVEVPRLDPCLDHVAQSLSRFFAEAHRRHRQGVCTIALTYAHPRSILKDIRQSSVVGCVERDLRLLQQLPVALRTVASGGVFWGDHMPSSGDGETAAILSRREQRLLAELMRNPNLRPVELSSQMGVSPTTTYRRIKSICAKLGVRTPLAAVLAAQQRGLLPSL